MANRIKIQVSGGALLFWAALLLILPLQWVAAAFLAAIVHECCHAVAVCILGSSIDGITIGGRGVVMETQPMTGIREFICALAGPLGSLLLLCFAPCLPRTAICGLVHGIYNLIPLFPMDGGRMLRSFLYSMLSPPLAKKIFLWVQKGIVFVIIVGCIILTFRMGILPLIFGCLILRNHLRENPLAKKPFWRYNRSTIDKEVRL